MASLTVALGAAARLDPAVAQEIRFFRIGTGTTGGTYFPVGAIISGAISGPPGAPSCDLGGSCGVPGLIAVAQASEGSVQNIQNMRDGSIEAALTQADVAYHAFSGTGIYVEAGPLPDLRGIARLYVEEAHIVVRADSDIEVVEDLRGRRVGLGEVGSGTLVGARLILEAYGLSESLIDPLYVGPEPAADLIGNEELDAFFIVGGAPMLAVADLARRVPVRLLPIVGQPAAGLLAQQPFFARATIPDNTYQGVEAVETIGVGALFVVSADVDEETVYGITRALWHSTTEDLLIKGHPRGSRILLENALDGLAVPLHPGALRYYGELGLARFEVDPPSAGETNAGGIDEALIHGDETGDWTVVSDGDGSGEDQSGGAESGRTGGTNRRRRGRRTRPRSAVAGPDVRL